MCGRYYIEIDEKELQDIVSEVEKVARQSPEQISFKASGEIFPTDTVPVQTAPSLYQPMKWGFIGFGGRPVINARSETALEKPLFKASMLERRCLIPASGYYEWRKAGSAKVKYQLYSPSGPMYFAGCYRQEKLSQAYSFVILARQAASGIEAIHDRMPVIIPRERIQTWFGEQPHGIDYAISELAYKELHI
jgi:putative SOS response-associated peptidase YedK